jgi:EpsI family protein
MLDGRLRAFAPAIILIAGCALLFQGTRAQESVPLAGPLNQVLAQVDGYRIEEQKVSDEERKVAGMSDYVARIYYRDTTLAFTTYVGYYDRQTQGKSIHSPKNCLPGAGWEVLADSTASIPSPTGPRMVNRYLLKNGVSQAVVYYWYQGRGRVVANEYAVKLNLLRDAALLGHTEEALVRVVLPVSGSDSSQARADELGTRIAARLMREVDQVLPRPANLASGQASPTRRSASFARANPLEIWTKSAARLGSENLGRRYAASSPSDR